MHTKRQHGQKKNEERKNGDGSVEKDKLISVPRSFHTHLQKSVLSRKWLHVRERDTSKADKKRNTAKTRK